MNKICTSIEQSKKLKELGIDVRTADMYWKNGVSDRYIQCFTPFVCGDYQNGIDFDYDIPAWSLSALLELIPFQIIEDNKRYGFKQYKGYNAQGETYRFEYVSNFGITLYETYYLNNPIDAAFEMTCWLLENKKIQ